VAVSGLAAAAAVVVVVVVAAAENSAEAAAVTVLEDSVAGMRTVGLGHWEQLDPEAYLQQPLLLYGYVPVE